MEKGKQEFDRVIPNIRKKEWLRGVKALLFGDTKYDVLDKRLRVIVELIWHERSLMAAVEREKEMGKGAEVNDLFCQGQAWVDKQFEQIVKEVP